jgi:hypothetical protein
VRLPELDRWRVAPPITAAALVAVYLILDPRSADFAAHVFRTELFEREGFTIWNGQWYGGHHTVAYSVLFPPLAALLGPALVGGLSSVASAALFESLLHRQFGRAGRWAALWFGVVAGLMIFTGRMPFALGVALGLAAVVALQRGWRVTSVVLAVACAISSPVAGLFLALAGIAYELAGLVPGVRREDSHRWAGAVVVTGALVPPVVLAILFPEGGWQPFTFESFVAVPIAAVVCFLLLPKGQPTLRIAVALYGIATIAAFAIPTPMGSNAVRLAELFVGPVLLLALALRPRSQRPGPALTAAMLALVGLWTVWAPVRDYQKVQGDPSVRASYYEPLLEFLETRNGGPWRVEVLFTKNHFEAAQIAPEFALARGWQRQLDVERNPLFYDRGIFNSTTYGLWLSEHGVKYVAVPDVEVDISSRLERALIASGRLSYLRLRFESEHWRVYEVTLTRKLAMGERGVDASVTELKPEEFTVRFDRPGTALVHVGWTPYWRTRDGCVEPAGRWTRVTARHAGLVPVHISLTLDRLVARGRRCG